MKTLYFSIILFASFLNAQNQDGYWDMEKKLVSTIRLSRGATGIIEYKLPVGTTEICYIIVPKSPLSPVMDDFSNALKNSGFDQAKALGYSTSFVNKISGNAKCSFVYKRCGIS